MVFSRIDWPGARHERKAVDRFFGRHFRDGGRHGDSAGASGDGKADDQAERD